MKENHKQKAYIVVTDSEYEVICFAKSDNEAITKANLHYIQEQDEDGRDDWTAYELKGFCEEQNSLGVYAVHDWSAWEFWANRRR